MAPDLRYILFNLNQNTIDMKLNKLITASLMGFTACGISLGQTPPIQGGHEGSPAKVSAGADVATPADAIVVQGDKLMVRKNGKMTAMASDTTLANGTVIMTDGTAKTKDGKVVMLSSGDVVAMTGDITKRDRYKLKDGKMVIKRDGKEMMMTDTVVLADGTRVMPDGRVMMKDGEAKALREDQEIDWDGRIKDDSIDSGPQGKRQ